MQVLPVTPKVEQIDNLLDNDSNFEEVDEDPTNDTNLEDEGSTDDEMENEEFDEEFLF